MCFFVLVCVSVCVDHVPWPRSRICFFEHPLSVHFPKEETQRICRIGGFVAFFSLFSCEKSEKKKKKPHVRYFSTCNSGAGSGCANFMGAWDFFCFHKVPRFREGVGFFLEAGAEAPIVFYGRGDFPGKHAIDFWGRGSGIGLGVTSTVSFSETGET